MCGTVECIPHAIPVLETKLEAFSRQVAGDVVHIFKQPPSTVYSSLKVGDLIPNALVELSDQLGQITTLEQPSNSGKPTPFSETTLAPPSVGGNQRCF